MYHDAVLSALDWWELAGVDTLADEQVRDWLAPVRAQPTEVLATARRGTEPTAPATARPAIDLAAAALLADLDAFADWWRTDPSLPGAPAHRVAPCGDRGSGLMILLDMPETGDVAANHLFSGEASLLFERMLAAIGRDRQSIYLASIWPSRPAGGIADRRLQPSLLALARHHIALVRPRRLLLVGRGPVHGLTGLDVAQARGRRHDIDGIPAVATQLLSPTWRAAAKAAAWADLLLLTEDL